MAMASSSCCSITKPIFNLPSLTTKKPLSPIIIISTTKPNKPIKLLHISKRHRFLTHLSQSSSEWETAADDSTVTLAQQQDDKVVEEEQVAEPAWGNTQQGGGGGEEGEEEEEGVFEEPSEDAKLFVGNLPYDVDSQKLASIFEQAGVVEIAEVIYNRDSDQSRGFGFVTMSTVEEAEKAVDMFNRYDLDGRLLTVNKAAPRGQRPERPPRVFEPSYRVYVGNLPWGVDDGRLEQLFSEHGKVTSARVIYDSETGRSRGFGFVTMATESEMNDSIAALDGQTMDGRAIRVNVAEERPRRMF